MKTLRFLLPLLAVALCLAPPAHAQSALHMDATTHEPENTFSLANTLGHLTGLLPTSRLALGVGVNVGVDANWSTDAGGYLNTAGGGAIDTHGAGGPINTSLGGGGVYTYSGGGSITTSGGGGSIKTNGIGSPNGHIAGPVGSLYMDQAGPSGQVLYVKEIGTGSTGWVASGATVLTNGRLAEYRFDEGAGRAAFNHVVAATSVNLLACPEGPFDQFSFWNGNHTTSAVTDRYALPPFGTGGATRWNQNGSQQLNQNVAVAAGTYTLSIYVASNTGASQNVATVLNGSISADVTVPATGWIRIVRSVTYSSAKTDNLSILYTNSAHAASDLLFYGPQFELGPTASDYVPTTSVATFAGTPAWVTGGVNLANGSFLGASFSRQNITAMTVYCVMQWPTATAAPYSNMSLLGDVQANNGYAGYHLDLLPAPPRCTFGGQTGYANLCNLHDGNWHLVAASSDGTTLRMFIDDVDVSDTTAAAAVFQTTILEIGNLSLTGYNFPGNIGYVSVYNVAHTSAQHAAQFAAIQGLMAAKGVALTVLPALVDFEGDSITAGLGGTTIYPTTVMAGLTPIVQGRNFAVAGNQISDLTARIATVDAQVNTARARNVLSVLIGHNDLVAGGESAATFVANLKTYCLARRAAGWNRIVLGTLLPSTVSGFNATRDAVNTLIRADTSFYDYLADYDTNPTIGADSAAANTTYYIDGTHPTTAGYNLMAPITQAAVTAALL